MTKDSPQDLLCQHRIGVDRRRRLVGDLDAQDAARGCRQLASLHAHHELGEIAGTRLGRDLSGVETNDVERSGDERRQPLDLRAHLPCPYLDLGIRHLPATAQHALHRRIHYRERSPELMGDERDEIPIDLGRLALARQRAPSRALLFWRQAEACAVLAEDGGAAAATAIMTTDTVPKEAGVTVGEWSIGGMAKGAGMLAPGLATMLVVLTTDADLAPQQLDEALREATRLTFDRADSDGCMSTNDTVTLLASGASGVTPELGAFTAALVDVCHDLARQLIADAEGAHHEIAIEVTNLSANRIRDLDQRGVDWKKFYEINFVDHTYKPFDASKWDLEPSGLPGPVRLLPYRFVDRGKLPE